MVPDWIDSFLITGLFQVVMVAGLALLLHLQLGLTRIANFGVVGFWASACTCSASSTSRLTGRSANRGSSLCAPRPHPCRRLAGRSSAG